MKFSLLYWASGALGASTVLSSGNFTSTIKHGTWFVKFYASWCRYSKRLAPEWEKLSISFDSLKDQDFFFGELECTLNGNTCESNKVEGYPTLLLFHDGKFIEEFDQDSVTKLEAQYMADYVKKRAKRYYKPVEIEQKKPEKITTDVPKKIVLEEPPVDKEKITDTITINEPLNSGFVVTLEPTRFDSSMQLPHPWIVLFYSPTCPHCQALKPIFIQAALKSKGRMNFGQVDCVENGAFCTKIGVQGVPDLRIFLHGKQLDQKVGERPLEELMKFVEKYYLPITVKKSIREVQSKIQISSQDTNLQKPFFVLAYSDKDDSSKANEVTDSLVGLGITNEIILVEDKNAFKAFNLKSTPTSIFSVFGSKHVEFTHSLDSVNILRSWAGSSQFPLSVELNNRFISETNLPDFHLIVGMYAKKTDDAIDSAKLKDFVSQSNLKYLQALGQSPLFDKSKLSKPTIFTYITGPVEHEARQALLSKLNVPYAEVQKQLLAETADVLLLLVDSSTKKYYYLNPNSEATLSPETVTTSLNDFQLGKLESHPLVTGTNTTSYILYMGGAMFLVGGLAWYLKKSRVQPEISYSRL